MKKRLDRTNRGYILAEGEVTGHCHSVAEEVELYEDGNVKFMTTFSPITITHEEHKAMVVEEAGDYTIGIVREMNHLKNEAEKVKD